MGMAHVAVGPYLSLNATIFPFTFKPLNEMYRSFSIRYFIIQIQLHWLENSNYSQKKCKIQFFLFFKTERDMSQSLIFGLITPFIATFLSLYYGLFVYFNLLKDFFLFRTKKTKEHPNAPKCLRDSKYGTHKYRYINVSSFLFYFSNSKMFV